MVRNRIRTTNKAKWGENSMIAAMNDVQNNVKTLREASRAYEIPVATLSDRLKKGEPKKLKIGRKPVFRADQEREISRYVLLLGKIFYGISSVELRRLVFEYAEKNNIPNDFNKSSRMAGQDWLYGFLKRNSNVSVKKPKSTRVSRINTFNEQEVGIFFNNLSSVMEKYNFDASQIYNFDETGISTIQKPGKISSPKAIKQVRTATSWERGKNIMVGCAMSAAGEYIPPMFIFPRKRLSPLLTRGGPSNSIYHCSSNGWMTEELFISWLKHFIKITKPTKQRPILLILDNHKTHTTLAAYDLCKENNVIVVTLPPHSSYRLQPLDITFYGSLKAFFNKECDFFMKSNPHQKITLYQIVSIFNNAYGRVANIEKGVSGFATAGIYPLDLEKFTNEDYAIQPITVQEDPLLSVTEDSAKEVGTSTFDISIEDPLTLNSNINTYNQSLFEPIITMKLVD